jgi:hypothetical protein
MYDVYGRQFAALQVRREERHWFCTGSVRPGSVTSMC